jgi:hypothetical protein
VYDIIDDLVTDERKKLREHLETHVNKKIPLTANIVKILIDVEIELYGIATYKDIKDQIMMD